MYVFDVNLKPKLPENKLRYFWSLGLFCFVLCSGLVTANFHEILRNCVSERFLVFVVHNF